jgi:hypothetical protein
MICEVSRLLGGDSSTTTDSWRLHHKNSTRVTDLLSLIEALALHETIYALPARQADDVGELELREGLIARGILEIIDTTRLHGELSESIIAMLSQVKDPVKVAGSGDSIGKPIDFDRQVRSEIRKFFETRPPIEPENWEFEDSGSLWLKFREIGPRIDDSFDFFEEGGGSSAPLYAETLSDCGKELIGWIEYHGSGAYEHCTSILRDMYYVLAAETLEIPYWPQSSRREFTSRFPNYFEKKILLELYTKLASEFKCTIGDIYDDHKDEIAFIPPFASLVLSRSRRKSDILNNMLEVREEYADLRKKLSMLERERQLARTIGTRLKIRKAQRNLLAEVSSVFSNPSLISFEGVLRYAPNLTKPLARPTDISSYNADLVTAPAKQLIRWWKRRPISKFFDLADKLKKTEDYPQLVSKLFGKEIRIGA